MESINSLRHRSLLQQISMATDTPAQHSCARCRVISAEGQRRRDLRQT
jgi:hypothetical protein